MAQKPSEFKNVLVIHFGQLGDVILAFPALKAIRDHFSGSKITILCGRSTVGILEIADFAEELISVDRVAHRDGRKVTAIVEIGKLVANVRRRKFDLVIDLHSLYETNLLALVSGAGQRLFANRDRRSIDWLSNYPVRPPCEDRSLHHADRYLNVIKALGLNDVPRNVRIAPRAEGVVAVSSLLDSYGLGDKTLIGFFLGAGHHSRRWSVAKFVETAHRLSQDPQNQVLVLLGPEERSMRNGLDQEFGKAAIIVDELPLSTLFALLSRIGVLVSGDTGPMHLGAVAGAGVVMLSQIDAPAIFHPLTSDLVVINDRPLEMITVEQVEEAVYRLINSQ